MTARRATLALLAALVASGAAAQEAEERPPFELRQSRPGDGPLSVYLRLLGAADRYPPQSAADSFVKGQLAQVAGGLGLHAEALRWDGLAYGLRPDSAAVLPPGTRALDAVAEIVRQSEGTSVVMVNEAHHDASTRLLTRDLLAPLYERGFRYLAAETFAPDSVLSAVTDYPTVGMGYYSDEPVFGALVREALRLGYILVPYEEERADEVEGDTLDGQQRRDLSQAQHLAERVFARDPHARVLVHAGYGHINEAPTEYFSPMAWYLREITGIDPLTVSQTEVWAAADPVYEHPTARAAREAGLVTDRAVILVDADRQRLAVSEREVAVDLFVIRPPVERPVAALGYVPLRPVVLPAVCGPCVVEVRRTGEGDDAVPVDRTVAFDGGVADLMGPPGEPLVATVIDGRTGRALDRRLALAR